MKLGLIGDFHPAIFKDETVFDLSPVLQGIMTLPGPLRLATLIARWDEYRPSLDTSGLVAQPLAKVRLRAPIPRPTKLLCGALSFREGVRDAKIKPGFFLKSSTSVIGPGDVVELPSVNAAVFHHEAELAVVIGAYAKGVTPETAMDHVFGYTCFMDISARGIGPGTGFQDKSYDTFGPMGPWIMTADDIADPHLLRVKFWVDGEARHDYPMSDIGNPIPELIAYASSIAALEPGDVLSLGVNHQGIGPVQDGETLRIEIAPIGNFEVRVGDPMKRRWTKGFDRGAADAALRMVRNEPLGAVTFAARLDG
jgi:2-keto-4-pentenoate hydratase/2-oxohepta-3-ene-1,7-dioic acid hydratase in catechol pathway